MLRQAQHFRCEHTETITESRRDVGALRHNVGAVIVTIFSFVFSFQRAIISDIQTLTDIPEKNTHANLYEETCVDVRFFFLNYLRLHEAKTTWGNITFTGHKYTACENTLSSACIRPPYLYRGRRGLPA